ncbi:MAG: DUF4019 domain-containing protein [Janthinobacterium lividum]
MKYVDIRVLAAVAALASSALVFDAAAAEQDMSPADVVGMGAQVLQMIDAGQAENVWDNASPILKAQVSRQQFNGKSNDQRKAFAASGGRLWLNVSRNRFPQAAPPAPPAGLYANVVFLTPGSAGETLSELISFRLESDNRWRVVGYVPEIRK